MNQPYSKYLKVSFIDLPFNFAVFLVNRQKNITGNINPGCVTFTSDTTIYFCEAGGGTQLLFVGEMMSNMRVFIIYTMYFVYYIYNIFYASIYLL